MKDQDEQVKKLLANRVATAKASCPDLFVGNSHIGRDGSGHVSSVVCKCCDTTIRADVVDSETYETINGKHVTKQRLVFACLPMYREVMIGFDDGSKHVTHICAECIPELSRPECLEAVYVLDLIEWSLEGPLSMHLVTRKPVAVIRSGPVME